MNYRLEPTGMGQGMTPAQAAGFAWANSQIADARAGLIAPSAQTLAAAQQFQMVSAAPPATTASTSTPYIIAGIVGVVVVGGLIYAATR